MFAADRTPGRSPRPRSSRRAAALAVLALTACSSGSSSDDDLRFTTAVTIDPLAFLGSVGCSDEPGAIQSYVATLTDESAEGGPSTLASSPPIPCSWRVSFTSVVEGHEYTARIDGYEEPAEQLTPKGGETSGSPEMTFEGAPAKPRWTWACLDPDATDGAGSLVAKEDVNIVVGAGACAAPTGAAEPDHAAIALDLASALGALRCQADGGEIASFDIIPQGSALEPKLGIACPPAEPVAYDLGDTPDRAYTFRLEAKNTAGDLLFGSSCVAAAREGDTVTASCDPLSATGALELDLDPLLAAADLACGDGASTYTASLPSPSGALQVGPVACGKRTVLSALAAGNHAASVEVRSAAGDVVLSGNCSGEVRPGATTRAVCTAVP
ncbi:hypothetical protein [Sorangium sp. So ce1000]|uniref:hypothetical protein n=1 Tax=Sorangium sp. So ce1000 TaxID=3133325 RepID=UPI003F629F3B